MGQIIDLDCDGCGLQGRGLALGYGMFRTGGPFESRAFWCPACQRLQAAWVLEPVAEVQRHLDGIRDRGHGWAGVPERIEMPYVEFVEALLRAHRGPRCDCGGRLRAVRLGGAGDGSVHPCPRCAERRLRVTQDALFD